MPGEQDILSLGLNIDTFTAQKMTTLREYISLFNDLSKYDGKIFNPVMGDGLTKFNTSIAETNRLIDQMNVKLSEVVNSNNQVKQSASSVTQTNTQLGLSVSQYSKELDKNAVLQAKLSVLSSDIAKENAALKFNISETTKALVEQSKASSTLSSNFGVLQAHTEEYSIEQQRIVATLRALAVEQDKQSSNREATIAERKKLAAQEYRIEQNRVVATLRALAFEQDKKINADVKEMTQLRNLRNDYGSMSRIIEQQRIAYENLIRTKGKDSPETKASGIQYRESIALANQLNTSLANTGTSAASIGRGLGSALNQLRNLAYILPGIGLAGIFNLAFQAIGEVISAIGGLTNSEDSLIEKNNDLNKSLKQSIDNYTELLRLQREFAGLAGSTFAGLKVEKQIKDQELLVSNLNAQGQSQDKILANELKLLEIQKEKAAIQVRNFGGANEAASIERLGNNIKETAARAANLNVEIIRVTDAIVRNVDYVDKATQKVIYSKDTKEKIRDSFQTSLDIVKADLQTKTDYYKNYFESIKNLDDKNAEIKKFNDDEERKRRLEFAKDNISVNIEKNKAILNNDKKFHDDKEAAIKKNLDNEKRLIEEARLNVVTNVTPTPKEKEIANNKAIDDAKKADAKAKTDLLNNDVEFYQRKILALTEIEKDQIELEAIANEKIFQNEQKSLVERLDAYENYIIQKQHITQKERDLAIQKGAAGPGLPTALTPEEQDRINVHNETQKYNTQADAEKKNYDITKQYLDQRIKDVKQANDAEQDIDKAAYAAELRANNERFKNKIFQYESFKKNKEFIDKKYGVILTLEKEIEDDKKDVERLSNLYKELFALKEAAARKTATAKDEFDNPDRLGGVSKLDAQRHVDEAVGQENAINDAIIKAQNELDAAKKKGNDDEIRNAKAKYDQLIQFAQEHAKNKKAIEEELWTLANNLVNGGVANEIEKIRQQTETRNEQFALQQTAIEDSTLALKDKHAVEVQLTQQKIELDKKAQLDERKIKHDAAVKDRELSVAHVLWGTAEAVIAALKLPPPFGEQLAIERGILGGLQVANILAVPIPSFAQGTGEEGLLKTMKVRHSEAGPEVIIEPNKAPVLSLKETIEELPKHTQIIPLREYHPEFDSQKKDNSWEQTRWLAKSIAKSNKKEIKNVFKPTIVVDMSFESHKRQILGY